MKAAGSSKKLFDLHFFQGSQSFRVIRGSSVQIPESVLEPGNPIGIINLVQHANIFGELVFFLEIRSHSFLFQSNGFSVHNKAAHGLARMTHFKLVRKAIEKVFNVLQVFKGSNVNAAQHLGLDAALQQTGKRLLPFALEKAGLHYWKRKISLRGNIPAEKILYVPNVPDVFALRNFLASELFGFLEWNEKTNTAEAMAKEENR